MEETRRPLIAAKGETEMELRLLVTQDEKSIFGERLTEARARLGMKFRERPRSQHAKIQLAFANLYGLFEKEGDPAERMIAGLAMHDLEMFPQSCPKPDLSHLPPWSVLECSDLWSLREGGGLFAWSGAVVPVVARQTRAILVYLAVESTDNTAFYRGTGFRKAGEPIAYPYAERLDDGEIRVQPMILEGEALTKLARAMSRLISGTSDHGAEIRLKNFFGLRPALNQRPARPASGVGAAGRVEGGTRLEPRELGIS